MASCYPQSLRFDPEVCRGQFVLSPREDLVPRGWLTRSHGRWILGYSRPLTCTVVRDQGLEAGWLIGHAVDSSGEMLGENREVSLRPAGKAAFQRWVDRLTGRFVAIQFAPEGPRVFQDIYGMLAAVFAPEEATLASTGLLIPVTGRTPFDRDRILAVDIPYRSAMYPLGLTPRQGIERMLPNHVLDLAAGRLTRIWPRESFGFDGDPAATTRAAATVVSGTMRGVAAVYPLQIPLTAGLDSRLLLACARDLLNGTLFFTADLGDESGWIDVTAARELAARFELTHTVFPWRRATREDRLAWAMRTGGETGEVRGWRSTRTLGMQEPGRASMTGFVGELARAYWWERFTAESVVTPELIVGRCHVPRRPEFLCRAEAWLGGLPSLDPIAVADVLYLEQRGACWAGVVEYGELGASAARLAPLCQADLVREFLRLPPDYRRERGVHLGIIESLWPELLEFPFNEGFAVPPARKRYYAIRGALADRIDRMGRRWRVLRHDPRRVLRRLGLARPPR